MTIQQYIDRQGVTKVAKTLGLSRQAVIYWRDLKYYPTPRNCKHIYAMSGKKIDLNKSLNQYLKAQRGVQ